MAAPLQSAEGAQFQERGLGERTQWLLPEFGAGALQTAVVVQQPNAVKGLLLLRVQRGAGYGRAERQQRCQPLQYQADYLCRDF